MPEFNLTLNTDTENQPENVSGLSMETADECRTEPNRKQCKGKETNLKKAKPKKNFKKRQILPMKTARPKMKVTKRNAKKLNKKGDKCCKISDLNRKVSFSLDKALYDPSKLVLDCDPCCDYPDRKKKSGSSNKDKRYGSPYKSRSNKHPKKSLNKGDPNEMNLLLDLLKSAKKRRFAETMEDCRDNKIENLRRWFLCNLKDRFGCSDCPNPCCRQPCIPCCIPMCPLNTYGDQPTNNIRDDLIQNCQKQFCEPKKACCGIMCPGCCCVRSNRCYLPCQGLGKPSACEICQRSLERSPCCCIDNCCSVSRTKSPKRKISKRSVPDENIKIQSRTWLLEKNKQLERELAGLRKQEKRMRIPFVCCEDLTEQVSRGHASTMLWEFLMESMVKALVESHPAVWEQKDVCQCRLQAMDFVLP